MSAAGTGTNPDSQSIKELFSQVLDLPPNCLKFSKVCPDHFVIGTYFLEEDPDVQPTDCNIEEKLKEVDIKNKNEALESGNKNSERDTNNERDGDENIKSQTQTRSGMLILCKLAVKAEFGQGLGVEVITLQKLAQPSAIYDLHFKDDILITTSTTGTLSLFKLEPSGKRGHGKFMVDDTNLLVDVNGTEKLKLDLDAAYLQHIQTSQLFDKSTLVISLNWHPATKDIFAVSLSDGTIAVGQHGYRNIGYLNDSSLGLMNEGAHLLKHTDSAWCVAWGDFYYTPGPGEGDKMIASTLYSGGDDCKLRYVRVIISPNGGSAETIDREIQISEAGVTALARLGSITGDTIHTDFLLVGSYDNKVRVLGISAPLEQEYNDDESEYRTYATLDLGGTVHKLSIIGTNQVGKDLPTKIGVLASCAHVGVRLLLISWSVESESFTIEVVAKFERHNSMNYASDVVLKNEVEDQGLKKFVEKEDMSICVSTSFYDRLLCVWGFKKYWEISVEGTDER